MSRNLRENNRLTRLCVPPRVTGLRKWVLMAAFLSFPLSAAATVHDSERAGHPLRMVAYVLHPVGYVLDNVIFKPAHWIGHWGPLRSFFGHDER
jgi:hypothetical protein